MDAEPRLHAAQNTAVKITRGLTLDETNPVHFENVTVDGVYAAAVWAVRRELKVKRLKGDIDLRLHRWLEIEEKAVAAVLKETLDLLKIKAAAARHVRRLLNEYFRFGNAVIDEIVDTDDPEDDDKRINVGTGIFGQGVVWRATDHHARYPENPAEQELMDALEKQQLLQQIITYVGTENYDFLVNYVEHKHQRSQQNTPEDRRRYSDLIRRLKKYFRRLAENSKKSAFTYRGRIDRRAV